MGGGCSSLTWLFLPHSPVDLLLGAVWLYKILKYKTGMRSGTRVSQESSSTTRLQGHFHSLAQQMLIQIEIASEQMSEVNPSHRSLQPNREGSELKLNLCPDLNLALLRLLLSATQDTWKWHQLLFLSYFGVKWLSLSFCITVEKVHASEC